MSVSYAILSTVIVENRRHARYAVGWPAWLEHRGELVPMTLFDLSAGGVGGITAAPLKRHEAVVLHTRHRQVPGRVVWYAAQRFGVAFDKLLAPNDPLLVAARCAR